MYGKPRCHVQVETECQRMLNVTLNHVVDQQPKYLSRVRIYAHTNQMNKLTLSSDAWTALVRTRLSTHALFGVTPRDRLKTLDEEWAAIGKALVEARRIRNSYTAACRAPREIMSLIFKAVMTIWQPYRTETTPTIYYPGWMTITHVCSLWREVRDSLILLTCISPMMSCRWRSIHHLCGLLIRIACLYRHNMSQTSSFALEWPL